MARKAALSPEAAEIAATIDQASHEKLRQLRAEIDDLQASIGALIYATGLKKAAYRDISRRVAATT